jgi:photosystem II stability/assembly factor-like uncharacterized protein
VTVTTPPRRPETEHDRDLERRITELEALIEEARRRARRRRQRNVAAALLVAAAGVAAFIGFGGQGGGGAGTAATARAPGSQGSIANGGPAPLGALPPDAGRPEAVAFDPHGPQIVYVMTQGHVFKTTDGGAHWQATAASGSGWVGANEALTADPRHPGTLFAGTQAGVYKTVDGGRSWRPSQRGLFVPHVDRLKGWVIALAVDPANTNIVYAGSDRVSKSTDGGHSWKTIFPPQPRQNRQDNVSALAIAPTRPEAIYAIKSDFANGRTTIYKSIDAGTSWQATTSVRGTYAMGFATALAVDPRHPTTVYAAIGANVLKTTDAGMTWQPIADGLPIAAAGRGSCHCQGGVTALAVDPRRTGTVYAAPTQGGIYKTTNGGHTWIRVIGTPLLEMYTVAVDPARPATVYAAGLSETGDGARILRSTNSGNTWATAP